MIGSVDLIMVLHRALELTKFDAEKNGFTYGPQSICNQALKKFDAWLEQAERISKADS